MASEETQELYMYYKDRGRELASEGDIEGAIAATEKAYRIHPSDKIKRRIEKMKAFLQEINVPQTEDNADTVEMDSGFFISQKIYNDMYPYQREAVLWLWGLHKNNRGGVIGDDMGLGKTIQIIAFLSGLFESGHIKHALIVMPVSLIPNWCTEFSKWNSDITISTFHSGTKSQREKNLMKIQRGGGVLITSYGMVTTNVDLLKACRGSNFVWDYVILDEGHKIKNPTKVTKAMHEIPAKHRIVLTGTPIQNNLRELWALYDFCHQGTLLGSLPTFKMQYETIITRSREKNATSGEKKLGNMMADSLRILISPYFLRRTKQEVLQQQNDVLNKENLGSPASLPETEKKLSKLPQKNDLIVWLFLSDVQLQIYDDFTKTDQVKSLLMTKKSPLVALTVLKKICDHPRLLSARACLQLGMNGEISQDELEEILADEGTSSPSIDVDHNILLKESGKLSVLIELLERLKEEGHRTLVFSQSRKMLDIINNILSARNWNVLRLDGTIKKVEERQECVKRFQTSDAYPVMLLTTQVGGVGLTLTAADRVVIYDPSWNPATDAQAVDRAYRIGQTKPVVVYRLITCGTVEEKIYRRQVFKDSITRKTTGASKDPHRYFTNLELKDLFRMDDPRWSSTQRQLEQMHAHQRLAYPELDEHLAYLHSLDIFGISDHDLMFQGNPRDPDDVADSVDDHDFIRSRVEKAKLLLQLESEQAHNENIRSGMFCKDLTNFQKPRTTNRNVVLDMPPDIPLREEDDEDSVIVEDVTGASDEELTEEELKDLKNLSIQDAELSKALEYSLHEMENRVRRKSGKFGVSEGMDQSYVLNLSSDELSAGVSDVLPKAAAEEPMEVQDEEEAHFRRAILLSLKEEQERSALQNSFLQKEADKLTKAAEKPVEVQDQEEADFRQALLLSLKEEQDRSALKNSVTQKEEDDLAKAIELSLIDVSSSSETSDDAFREKEEVLKTPVLPPERGFQGTSNSSQRRSKLDLSSVSLFDQDFAEAFEIENSNNQVDETSFFSTKSTQKSVSNARNRSILVLDSDEDDDMPNMDTSRSSVGGADVVYETDEESLGDVNASMASENSTDLSIVSPKKAKRPRVLESTTEEDSDYSAQENSQDKSSSPVSHSSPLRSASDHSDRKTSFGLFSGESDEEF